MTAAVRTIRFRDRQEPDRRPSEAATAEVDALVRRHLPGATRPARYEWVHARGTIRLSTLGAGTTERRLPRLALVGEAGVTRGEITLLEEELPAVVEAVVTGRPIPVELTDGATAPYLWTRAAARQWCAWWGPR